MNIFNTIEFNAYFIFDIIISITQVRVSTSSYMTICEILVIGYVSER